jgi:hypothetical protein
MQSLSVLSSFVIRMRLAVAILECCRLICIHRIWLCFLFPCIARCVEFACRRHFNSLCFACTFLIILADWDNSCLRLSDCCRFLRSYYASCMSRSLCVCIQTNLMCIPQSRGALHRVGRFPLPGSLGVGATK